MFRWLRRMLREQDEANRLNRIASDLTHMSGIKQHMLLWGVFPPQTFRGCTTAEIEELVRAQKVNRWPSLYLEFLREMGRSAGSYVGPEACYPALLTAKQQAIEALDAERTRNPDVPMLPDDAFVFYFRLRQEPFYFFRTRSTSIDPVFHEYGTTLRTAFIEHKSLLAFYQTQLTYLEDQLRHPSRRQGKAK